MNELLTDTEKSNIIFQAINTYKKGENDFFVLISVLALQTLTQKKVFLNQIDTQDVYDNIIECFNFFNDFVQEKKMDFPLIQEELYDVVAYMINEAIKQIE